MSEYNTQIVAPGNRFSELARQICVASFTNSPALTIQRGGSGMRAMDGFVWNEATLRSMLDKQVYEVAQSDGSGGKSQFFTLCNTPEAFRGLGWEVITMNADDAACRGGLATMMLSSNIDVKQITDGNWHLCEALLQGFGDALKQSNLVLMTGETAVMPHCITAFCDTGSEDQLIMTWNATCLGLASSDKQPNGTTIKPGMIIVGFKDEGYRCNGGTKFTNIILDTWGDGYASNAEAAAFIQKVVIPSRSYANTISRLNGWNLDGSLDTPPVKLHGVAHITGGGIWSKLVEILPEGVGADLDSMPEPASVLLEAQQLASKTDSPMSDFECHGTFHGGCGMMIVCEEADVERIVTEARADGHDPSVVGKTTESTDSEVTIQSRFHGGAHLSSLHPH
jgi:phosphoribosylformylglycinamidine cyclo-ligase